MTTTTTIEPTDRLVVAFATPGALVGPWLTECSAHALALPRNNEAGRFGPHYASVYAGKDYQTIPGTNVALSFAVYGADSVQSDTTRLHLRLTVGEIQVTLACDQRKGGTIVLNVTAAANGCGFDIDDAGMKRFKWESLKGDAAATLTITDLFDRMLTVERAIRGWLDARVATKAQALVLDDAARHGKAAVYGYGAKLAGMRRAIDNCQMIGWLDSEGKLTDKGYDALAAYAAKHPSVIESIPARDVAIEARARAERQAFVDRFVSNDPTRREATKAEHDASNALTTVTRFVPKTTAEVAAYVKQVERAAMAYAAASEALAAARAEAEGKAEAAWQAR